MTKERRHFKSILLDNIINVIKAGFIMTRIKYIYILNKSLTQLYPPKLKTKPWFPDSCQQFKSIVMTIKHKIIYCQKCFSDKEYLFHCAIKLQVNKSPELCLCLRDKDQRKVKGNQGPVWTKARWAIITDLSMQVKVKHYYWENTHIL